MPEPPGLRRRELLAGGACSVMIWPTVARADAPPTGWVPSPEPMPPLHVTGSDGRRWALPAVLRGGVSAVQLMFTGCSATCPTQGALFGMLASRSQARATPDGARFLSISIDALGDTPAMLEAWQARFGRHPAWRCAVAEPGSVDRLSAYLKGAAARSGTHTAQVFLFDRETRLRHRSGDLPSAREVEALLAQIG